MKALSFTLSFGKLLGMACWPWTCHISRAAKEPCCFASRASTAARWGRGRALGFQDHDHGPRSWTSTHGTVAQCRSNWISPCATAAQAAEQWQLGVRGCDEGWSILMFPCPGSIYIININLVDAARPSERRGRELSVCIYK